MASENLDGLLQITLELLRAYPDSLRGPEDPQPEALLPPNTLLGWAWRGPPANPAPVPIRQPFASTGVRMYGRPHDEHSHSVRPELPVKVGEGLVKGPPMTKRPKYRVRDGQTA